MKALIPPFATGSIANIADMTHALELVLTDTFRAVGMVACVRTDSGQIEFSLNEFPGMDPHVDLNFAIKIEPSADVFKRENPRPVEAPAPKAPRSKKAAKR